MAEFSYCSNIQPTAAFRQAEFYFFSDYFFAARTANGVPVAIFDILFPLPGPGRTSRNSMKIEQIRPLKVCARPICRPIGPLFCALLLRAARLILRASRPFSRHADFPLTALWRCFERILNVSHFFR